MPSLTSKGDGKPSKFGLGRKKTKKNPAFEDIKIDLHESHAEKEARRLKSYADPNMAVNQLEPSAMQMEQTTMESLSMRQHRDIYGNPIADPDLSNPTRHRLERPLDTIRAFEAAIEESYSTRRASYGSRNNDRRDYRFARPPNPHDPSHPRTHRNTSASTSSSPTSSHPDDDSLAGGPSGAVQPPPSTTDPYGYSNAGIGGSRSRPFITPPAGVYPTPPTSQAGMAWASAPAKAAPPRRPIVGGGGVEEKEGRFRFRLGRKKRS